MPDLNNLMDPWIEALSIIIELAGIFVIVAGLLWATYVWLKERAPNRYVRYRQQIGRSLLLGLELLVAADIVRTVVLQLTLESLGTLALLILIRTFLSWALEVEIEGRWPWEGQQRRKESERGLESREDSV